MNRIELNLLGRSIGEATEKNEFLVTEFPYFTAVIPSKVINISEFLFCENYRTKVEEVRRCEDKNARRYLKSKLPCITPSGIFEKRCNSGLLSHSGLICIDVDQQEEEASDWERMKILLSGLPGLYYCGLSVSGNGLFFLFKISDPKNHILHFNALKADFQKAGIKIDDNCKDLARLRCISYDKAPIYIPEALSYEKKLSLQFEKNFRSCSKSNEADITETRIRRIISTIDANNIDITNSYSDWYAIGRALASQFGEGARSIFHLISSKSEKYNFNQCDYQYNKCLDTCDNTSINTFFWICSKFGIIAK